MDDHETASLVTKSWLLDRLGPSRPRGCGEVLSRLLSLPLLGHLTTLWSSLDAPVAPFSLVRQRILLSLLSLPKDVDGGLTQACVGLVGEALRCGEEEGRGDGSKEGVEGRKLVHLSVALLLHMRPGFRGGGEGGMGAREAAAEGVLRGCVAEVVAGVRVRANLPPRVEGGGGEDPQTLAQKLTRTLTLCSPLPPLQGEGGEGMALSSSSSSSSSSATTLPRRRVGGLLLSDLPLGVTLAVASAPLLGALRYTTPSPDFTLNPAAKAALAARGKALLEATQCAGRVCASTLHSKRVESAIQQQQQQQQEQQEEGEGGGEPSTAATLAQGEEALAAAHTKVATSRARLEAALPTLAAFLYPDLEERVSKGKGGSGPGTSGLLGGGESSTAAAPPRGGAAGAAKGPLVTLGGGARGVKRGRGDIQMLDVEEIPVNAAQQTTASSSSSSSSSAASAGAGAAGGGGGDAPSAKVAKVDDPEAKKKRLLELLQDAPDLTDSERAMVTAFAQGENKLAHHPKYSAEAAAKAEEAAAAAVAAAAAAAATLAAAVGGGGGGGEGGAPKVWEGEETSSATSSSSSAAAAAAAPPPKYPGLPSHVSPKVTLELRTEIPKAAAGGIGGGGTAVQTINRVFLELDFSTSSWRTFLRKKK